MINITRLIDHINTCTLFFMRKSSFMIYLEKSTLLLSYTLSSTSFGIVVFTIRTIWGCGSCFQVNYTLAGRLDNRQLYFALFLYSIIL